MKRFFCFIVLVFGILGAKDLEVLENDCAKVGYENYDKISKACYDLGVYYESIDENKAIDYYQKSCDAKGKDACYKLAFLKKGFFLQYYLRLACDLGDKKSCDIYNEFNLAYDGSVIYVRDGIKYKPDCDKGDVKACAKLGFIYEKIHKLDEAKKIWELTCENNFYEDCQKLGLELYKTSHTYDAKIATYLEKACKSGLTQSCITLGDIYYNGYLEYYGVKKDKKKAIQYYHKACDDGSNYTCSILGDIYASGKLIKFGIERDMEKALYYYRKICDGGSNYYCYTLGDMYSGGYLVKIGIEKDTKKAMEKAIKYYQKACDNKHTDSCWKLAKITNSKEYLLKICDYGSGYGCFVLASVYENENNIDLAEKYYDKSCKIGITDGCHSYKILQHKKSNGEYKN